jgi:hypothetical protein
MAEIESTGFGSRLGKSCLGVVLGPILFIIGFPVLFYGEGRAVHRAQTLAAGKDAAIDVSADKIDPANDTRLVHLTGEATTSETLADKTFGIAEKNAIKLNRTVEIYQWKETSTSETKKKLGGGEEKITKYHHNQEWVNEPWFKTAVRLPGQDTYLERFQHLERNALVANPRLIGAEAGVGILVRIWLRRFDRVLWVGVVDSLILLADGEIEIAVAGYFQFAFSIARGGGEHLLGGRQLFTIAQAFDLTIREREGAQRDDFGGLRIVRIGQGAGIADLIPRFSVIVFLEIAR